jgi:hypothetical protein
MVGFVVNFGGGEGILVADSNLSHALQLEEKNKLVGGGQVLRENCTGVALVELGKMAVSLRSIPVMDGGLRRRAWMSGTSGGEGGFGAPY